MLGSKKVFVITEAPTHGPGHGAVYHCSEPSVIPWSYPGAPHTCCFGFNALCFHWRAFIPAIPSMYREPCNSLCSKMYCEMLWPRGIVYRIVSSFNERKSRLSLRGTFTSNWRIIDLSVINLIWRNKILPNIHLSLSGNSFVLHKIEWLQGPEFQLCF